MATTYDQIESFRRFALERLTNRGPDVEFDELVFEWQESLVREAIDADIRQGLADIDAGLGRPAREVSREIARRYGLPNA
jgi:predicted transcriptional regulator